MGQGLQLSRDWGELMNGQTWKILFYPNGPFGLTEGFFQNLTSEMTGFVLSAIVFSILIPTIIDWRQARKWRPARLNFGQELLGLHVAPQTYYPTQRLAL